MRYIGKPILRVEDDVILRGRAQYVDDIEPPGVLYAGFVRSPYAHARVVKVDLSDVRGAKGVVAVFGPELGFAPGGKVRYQGEAVAMVVARDRYLLYDALEKAVVEYEPLPAVLDIFEAMKPGAPLVDESLGSNIASERYTKVATWRARLERRRGSSRGGCPLSALYQRLWSRVASWPCTTERR